MGKKDKLSANPADAARKAARQRELKKNKASREKSREFNLVKKNTSGTEAELRTLEKSGKGKTAEADGLREELKKAKEAKDKYLEAHPEHRKFIYPHSKDEAEDGASQQQQSGSSTIRGDTGRGLFGPDGKPRFPERSIYYDPVFNPWGNPPPGMPYVEKPPHQWASTSARQAVPQPPSGQLDYSEDEDDDDDIVMPTGPPPAEQQAGEDDSSDDSSDEDDDIVMPSGPPPPRPPIHQAAIPAGFAPPPPSGYSVPPPSFPRPPMGYAGPPPNHFGGRPPLPPQGFAGPIPRPPPGQHRSHPYARPPLPPNGYSGRPMQGNGPPRPRPPPNAPTGPSASSSATISAPPRPALTEAAKASATISSAPQLRDLKKEAVAFLPSSVRKQKSKAVQKAKVAGLGRSVRANPEIEDEEDDQGEDRTVTPDEESMPRAQPMEHSPVRETTSSSMVLPPAAGSLPPLAPSSKGARPPPVAASAPKSSLVGYYDSDDSDAEEEDQTGPATTAPSQPPQKGRVNLVEALRSQMPVSSASGAASEQQSKNGNTGGGQGDYEKYLQSLGDLL